MLVKQIVLLILLVLALMGTIPSPHLPPANVCLGVSLAVLILIMLLGAL